MADLYGFNSVFDSNSFVRLFPVWKRERPHFDPLSIRFLDIFQFGSARILFMSWFMQRKSIDSPQMSNSFVCTIPDSMSRFSIRDPISKSHSANFRIWFCMLFLISGAIFSLFLLSLSPRSLSLSEKWGYFVPFRLSSCKSGRIWH